MDFIYICIENLDIKTLNNYFPNDFNKLLRI